MSNSYRAHASQACPDCRPDTELVQVSPNLWALNVTHDTTCPAYTAMTTPRKKKR